LHLLLRRLLLLFLGFNSLTCLEATFRDFGLELVGPRGLEKLVKIGVVHFSVLEEQLLSFILGFLLVCFLGHLIEQGPFKKRVLRDFLTGLLA
jgi:hypothetical protein